MDILLLLMGVDDALTFLSMKKVQFSYSAIAGQKKMHFSASVTICVFLNEDNEEKWAQATFSPDYETEGKRFQINPMHMNFGNLIVFLNYLLH